MEPTPNMKQQHKITRMADESHEKSSPYTLFYHDTILKALKDLSNADAIKLYIYLSVNKPNYTFDLSKTDCIDKTGISRAGYFRAVQALIDKQYLIPMDSIKKCFQFYPTAKIENFIVPEPTSKKKKAEKNNSINVIEEFDNFKKINNNGNPKEEVVDETKLFDISMF